MSKSSQLKFIGMGGAFSSKYHNNSAYMVKGDKFILFDCGEDIFKQVIKSDLVDPSIKEMDVIITHTHSDHVGSLETMIFYCRYRGIKATIIFPNKQLIKDFLDIQGMHASSYELKTPSELDVDYYLKEYDQVHGDFVDGEFIPMEAYGYHFKDDEYNFFYSGDTNRLSDEIKEMFLSGQIDHMYHEVDKSGWPTHMKIEDLLAAIPESERHRVTLMHISDKFTKEDAQGFNIAE